MSKCKCDDAMGLYDIDAGDIFGDIADSASSAASDALSQASTAAENAITNLVPGFGAPPPTLAPSRPRFALAGAAARRPVVTANLLSPTGRVVGTTTAFKTDPGMSLPMFQAAPPTFQPAAFAAASQAQPAAGMSTNTMLLVGAAAIGAFFLLGKK
jgi:hypothetical protein